MKFSVFSFLSVLFLIGGYDQALACQVYPCPGMGGGFYSSPKPKPAPQAEPASYTCTLAKSKNASVSAQVEVPSDSEETVYDQVGVNVGKTNYSFNVTLNMSDESPFFEVYVDFTKDGDGSEFKNFACLLPETNSSAKFCVEEVSAYLNFYCKANY